MQKGSDFSIRTNTCYFLLFGGWREDNSHPNRLENLNKFWMRNFVLLFSLGLGIDVASPAGNRRCLGHAGVLWMLRHVQEFEGLGRGGFSSFVT